MTDSLKYRLRGVLYICSGAFLLISSVMSWKGLNFLWVSTNSTTSEHSSMRITVTIIGLALMAASYFEFANARMARRDEQQRKEQDN